MTTELIFGLSGPMVRPRGVTEISLTGATVPSAPSCSGQPHSKSILTGVEETFMVKASAKERKFVRESILWQKGFDEARERFLGADVEMALQVFKDIHRAYDMLVGEKPGLREDHWLAEARKDAATTLASLLAKRVRYGKYRRTTAEIEAFPQ